MGCGPKRNEGNNKFRVAPINTKILSHFAAGQMACTNGDYALMEDYKKLISAKTVVPWIQGTPRYAWRLSSERVRIGDSTTPGVDAVNKNGNVISDPDLPDPASAIVDTEYSELDKEVGEAAAFAVGSVGKLWACSKKAGELVWPQVEPGVIAGRQPVNYQLVKTAFECNYKCLLTSCTEMGSLRDGDPQIRNGAKTCADKDLGTNPVGYKKCTKSKAPFKNKCKPYTGKPGIKKRDKLEYFAEELP